MRLLAEQAAWQKAGSVLPPAQIIGHLAYGAISPPASTKRLRCAMPPSRGLV